MTTPLVITAAQVRELILNAGVPLLSDQVKMDSTCYTLLDEDWLMGSCRTAYLDGLWSMGMTKTEAESGDCNCFTLWLVSDITKWHRRTPGRPKAAIGAGWLRTTLDNGVDHSLAVFITLKAGMLALRTFEAQPSVYGFKNLSETELASVQDVKMV